MDQDFSTPRIPAEAIPDSPRYMSIGGGNRWGFANIDREEELNNSTASTNPPPAQGMISQDHSPHQSIMRPQHRNLLESRSSHLQQVASSSAFPSLDLAAHHNVNSPRDLLQPTTYPTPSGLERNPSQSQLSTTPSWQVSEQHGGTMHEKRPRPVSPSNQAPNKRHQRINVQPVQSMSQQSSSQTFALVQDGYPHVVNQDPMVSEYHRSPLVNSLRARQRSETSSQYPGTSLSQNQNSSQASYGSHQVKSSISASQMVPDGHIQNETGFDQPRASSVKNSSAAVRIRNPFGGSQPKYIGVTRAGSILNHAPQLADNSDSLGQLSRFDDIERDALSNGMSSIRGNPQHAPNRVVSREQTPTSRSSPGQKSMSIIGKIYSKSGGRSSNQNTGPAHDTSQNSARSNINSKRETFYDSARQNNPTDQQVARTLTKNFFQSKSHQGVSPYMSSHIPPLKPPFQRYASPEMSPTVRKRPAAAQARGDAKIENFGQTDLGARARPRPRTIFKTPQDYQLGSEDVSGTSIKSRGVSTSRPPPVSKKQTSLAQPPRPEVPKFGDHFSPQVETPNVLRSQVNTGNFNQRDEGPESEKSPAMMELFRRRGMSLTKKGKKSNAVQLLDHLDYKHPKIHTSKVQENPVPRPQRPNTSEESRESNTSKTQIRGPKPHTLQESSEFRPQSGPSNPLVLSPANQPEVIDLSTPEIRLIQRSRPMRERLESLKKPETEKEKPSPRTARAPKGAALVDLATPKTPRVSKKAKTEELMIQQTPAALEAIKQSRAAALITKKMVDALRPELDPATLAELQEKEEASKVEIELQEKAEREEARLARFLKEERARVAAEEKEKRLAEEKHARDLEKQRVEEEKRRIREMERLVNEPLEKANLEKKRNEAEQKMRDIAARRAKAEEEQAQTEAERKAAEERANAAHLAELADIKAKQEAAKKQALSLKVAKKKRNAPEVVRSSLAGADAQTGNIEDEDTMMHDVGQEEQEDEDSLFMPDVPMTSQPSSHPPPPRVTEARAESSSATEIRQLEEQALKDEAIRKYRASISAKLKGPAAASEALNPLVPSTLPAAQLVQPRKQVSKRPPPAKNPKQQVKNKMPMAKFVQQRSLEPAVDDNDGGDNDNDDDDDDEEIFNFRPNRFAPQKPVYFSGFPSASSQSNPQLPPGNFDEDVVFDIPSVVIPEPEARPISSIPILPESSFSQPAISQSSRTAIPQLAAPAPSSSVSVVQDDDEEPQPNSPAFRAKLRAITRKKQSQGKAQEIAKKKADAAEARRARQKEIAKQQRTDKVAEKKRQEIMAEAAKNEFVITKDSVEAQVVIFMEKRAKELQRRADRAEAKKLGGNASAPKNRNNVSNKPNAKKLAAVEVLREKTKEAAARRENQGAASFASDSDDDSDDRDALARALEEELEAAFAMDEDTANAEAELEIFDANETNSDSEYDSDIESEIESDTDIPKPRHDKRTGLAYVLKLVEPPALPIAEPVINPASQSKLSRLKGERTSLLPKNIFDSPPIRSANMSTSPICNGASTDHGVILINIFSVMQHRIKGNPPEAEETVVDNYGLLVDAEDRIQFEVSKFRKSGIRIVSIFMSRDDNGYERVKIVHTKNGDYCTEFFLKVTIRKANTLSGYDPDLFTPVTGKRVWTIVQRKIMKDPVIPSEMGAVDSDDDDDDDGGGGGEVDEAAGNESEESDEDDDDIVTVQPQDSAVQEDTTAANSNQEILPSIEVQEDGVENLFGDDEPTPAPEAEIYPIPSESTRPGSPTPVQATQPNSPVPESQRQTTPSQAPEHETEVDVQAENEVETAILTETEATVEAEPENQTPVNPEYENIGTFTSLHMANTEACETVIRLTKPEGARIGYIEAHRDASEQLRELRDHHNRKNTHFEADIISDASSLPWVGWKRLRMYVVEQTLSGPLNI